MRRRYVGLIAKRVLYATRVAGAEPNRDFDSRRARGRHLRFGIAGDGWLDQHGLLPDLTRKRVLSAEWVTSHACAI